MIEATNEPDAEPALTDNSDAHQSPGALLHEARTRLGYSLDDLAHETRLFKSTLHQLEIDEYRELPQPPLAGAYYRQCARVLGLDEDRIVAACREHAGAAIAPKTRDVVNATNFGPADVTPRGSSRLPRLLALILLIVALAVAAVVILLPSMSFIVDERGQGADDSAVISIEDAVSLVQGERIQAAGLGVESGASRADKVQTTSTAETSSGQNATGASGPNGPNQARATASGDVDRLARAGDSTRASAMTAVGLEAVGYSAQDAGFVIPASGAREVSAVFSEPNSIVATAIAAKRQREATAKDVQSAPSVPPNRLELEFDAECWVRLTDANGNRLFMGLLQAGDTRVFNAPAPYHLKLGYAAAAEITIGGQPVEIGDEAGVVQLTIAAATNVSTHGPSDGSTYG